MAAVESSADVLRRPVPGPLFRLVKVASYVELALFAALLVVWVAPGMHGATFAFGLGHGIGFIALALLIWAAVLRHEAPYWLLAATLTPAGPVGSVIGIRVIERRHERREPGPIGQPGSRKEEGRDREGGHTARPARRTDPQPPRRP